MRPRRSRELALARDFGLKVTDSFRLPWGWGRRLEPGGWSVCDEAPGIWDFLGGARAPPHRPDQVPAGPGSVDQVLTGGPRPLSPARPEALPWPSREPCRRARRRCCSLTTSASRTTSSPSWTTSPRSSRPPSARPTWSACSGPGREDTAVNIQIEDETQVSRATQGEQDNYEMHVRAANIVRAGESLMKLVSDLKQFLILNDFPSVNEAIDQRNQQLRALQEECDRKLITLRDEISIDLYELEEEYYSSRYR
uniref:Mediator of RNA polymerase II transcription subunit 22 n=1 Tax=Equus caballus TaxID=9796 RepID=F6SQD1_HORSE